MLPFNPRFRSLLHIFVPKLSNKDLDKHEQLLALRNQLIQERNILINEYNMKLGEIDQNSKKNGNDKRKRKKKKKNELMVEIDSYEDIIKNLKLQIEETTNRSRKILAPFTKDFKRVQKLYFSRRRKLIMDKKFQQLPNSPKEAWYAAKDNVMVRWQGFKLFWLYLPRRIKLATIDSSVPQKVTSAAVAVMFASSIYFFHGYLKRPSEISAEPSISTPGVVTETLSKDTITGAASGTMQDEDVAVTDTSQQAVKLAKPVAEK